MPDKNLKEYSDMVAKPPPDEETGSMPSNHHGAYLESPLPSAGKPVAGIEAARAGHMTALGVARLRDAAQLRAAGADLVVTSLDEIVIDDLADGRLCRRST